MNELSTEVNEELLSLSEAAALRRVTVSAISHALSDKPELKLAHYKKIGKKGYVSKKGLFLLYTQKDAPRGGMKDLDERTFIKEKTEEVKEIVTKGFLEYSSDPIIAMRIQQMELDKRVTALEVTQPKGLEELKARVDDFLDPAQKLTKSQRTFLTERANALAYKMYGVPTSVDFSYLRRTMNDAVGRNSVESYKMEDYHVAVRWLKSQYLYHKLEW